MKHTHILPLLLIVCAALLAGCAPKQAAAPAVVPEGGHQAEGMADCEVPADASSYTVLVQVTTDAHGAITDARDAGTSVPPKHESKHRQALALLDTLPGRTLDTLGDVDAVSGATDSSKALLAAVEQALEAIRADSGQ